MKMTMEQIKAVVGPTIINGNGAIVIMLAAEDHAFDSADTFMGREPDTGKYSLGTACPKCAQMKAQQIGRLLRTAVDWAEQLAEATGNTPEQIMGHIKYACDAHGLDLSLLDTPAKKHTTTDAADGGTTEEIAR